MSNQKFRQNEINKLDEKYNASVFQSFKQMVEKHFQLNKKLKNLKIYFLSLKNFKN